MFFTMKSIMTNITIKNLSQADCFVSIFQHVKLFTEHINIIFSNDKMFIQSMDPSRVSIFEIYIPNTWFDDYSINGENTTIGISSSMLYKVLNTKDKRQEISIIYDEDNSDKLLIQFTCEDKDVYDKFFEIPLMDIESELMNVPEMNSAASFSLPSLNFADLIKNLKIFGDSLEINCDENEIKLLSKSNESGKMKVNINFDDLLEYEIEEDATISSSYSLNILHNVCLYNKISNNIGIHMTENYPLKLVYSLDEDADNAKLVFYIAPKIDE